MQLKYKIPLILFAVFLVLIGTFVTSVLSNSSKVRKEAQLETARAAAQDYSNITSAFMQDRIAELKGFESNVSVMKGLSAQAKAENISKLLKEISNNPVVTKVYTDESKRTSKPYLTEPYEITYQGETKKRRAISLHVGATVMGIDIDILQKELFNRMQDSKKSSYVVFVSSEGLIVAHPKQDLILTYIGGDFRKGKSYVVNKEDVKTGETFVQSFVPMELKGVEQPWSIAYVVPLSVLRGDELKMRYTVMGIFGVAIVSWFLFLLWLMSSVFKRLIRTVNLLAKMTEGEGDLTMRLAEDGNDEIGQMSKGLNSLIDKLHSTIKTTQKDAKNLLNTFSSLHELSGQLSKISENALSQSAKASESTTKASDNARAIAGDANRTSSRANELAGTAEQMSLNMNSVAGAVEELSASFAQIMGSSDESRKIAYEAAQKSSHATEVMGKLGLAAEEIGQVTEVIKRIADKTNLLALNATIEAASAGDAGRGFAVVAGEIKDLANQSAKSADDITRRIDGIQSGTSNAVEVINSVAEIISKINASIDTIASNVGEQTKASNEIANNAEQASIGAKRVVSSIGEVAKTATYSAESAGDVAKSVKSISGNMTLMYDNAKKTNATSTELKEAANTLKTAAERLDSIVCKFRT
jgi:methyl-accepting chemotaxis protein